MSSKLLWLLFGLCVSAILLNLAMTSIGGDGGSGSAFFATSRGFREAFYVEPNASSSTRLPPVTTKTKSTTDPAVSEWFRLKGEELEERKRRLRAFCSRRPDLGRLRVLPKRDLMVTTRHNLTYCRQAKVATSTLLYHFLQLSDSVSDADRQRWEHNVELLHIKVPRLYRIEQLLEEEGTAPLLASDMGEFFQERGIFSFSFVRHPFERIASAFQNKVVETSYHGLVYKIGGPNFTRFVDYVLKDLERDPCPPLKPCHIDLHWRPLHNRCGYCDVPYHMIGKLETFQEDFKYLSTVTGILSYAGGRDDEGADDDDNDDGEDGQRGEETLSDDDFKLNAAGKTKSGGGGGSSFGRTLEYFSQLDKRRKQRLYKAYKVDFDMFGYDHKPFM